MNQQELINDLAESTGENKATVGNLLQALGQCAQRQLKYNGEITLPGIGKLSIKAKAARAGRNPKTGEKIQIAAKRVPGFTALKALKEAVA